MPVLAEYRAKGYLSLLECQFNLRLLPPRKMCIRSNNLHLFTFLQAFASAAQKESLSSQQNIDIGLKHRVGDEDTFTLLIELATSWKLSILEENIGAFENCSEGDHHKSLGGASWEREVRKGGIEPIKVYLLSSLIAHQMSFSWLLPLKILVGDVKPVFPRLQGGWRWYISRWMSGNICHYDAI